MLDVPEDLSLYEQLAGLKDYNYIFIPIKKYLFYFDLLTCLGGRLHATPQAETPRAPEMRDAWTHTHNNKGKLTP